MGFWCERDRHSPFHLGRDIDSLYSHPLPFKCRIVPRFPGMDAEELEKLIAASTA